MLLSVYICCSRSTLRIDLVGITRWTRQEDSAPSAHECLKPLEVSSLFTDEGEKGSVLGHRCEAVPVKVASWGRWASSTWGAYQPVRTLNGKPINTYYRLLYSDEGESGKDPHDPTLPDDHYSRPRTRRQARTTTMNARGKRRMNPEWRQGWRSCVFGTNGLYRRCSTETSK